MLKRQDSFVSSSSRRDNTPLQQPEKRPVKSVGCFSGIVHFLSKYQIGRRRKFLTFGKKQSGSTVLPPSPKPEFFEAALVSPVWEEKLIDPNVPMDNVEGFNAGELRSKIRPHGNYRSSNLSPTENKFPTTVSISSGEETRRKLLDALDKCDNDLKTLKEIIQTVRFQEEKAHKVQLQEEEEEEEDYCSVVATSDVAVMKDGMRFDVSEKAYELTRSTFNNGSICSKRHDAISIIAGGQTHEQKPALRKKKKPGESYNVSVSFLNRVAKGLLEARYKRTCTSYWSSKALIESVDEVCGDICWGEKREVRRLGLELQEDIYGELIEEFLRDFGSSEIYSLPFQKCKRRIQF